MDATLDMELNSYKHNLPEQSTIELEETATWLNDVIVIYKYDIRTALENWATLKPLEGAQYQRKLNDASLMANPALTPKPANKSELWRRITELGQELVHFQHDLNEVQTEIADRTRWQ